MNLPKLITDLVETQNSHDAVAYSALFSENAIVYDEGNNHVGKSAIQKWIEKANQDNQTVLKPISYQESDSASVFIAQVSGTFSGSPATLKFNMEIEDDMITSLKITG